LRIQIRDPVLFDPWLRDPGWVKSQDPDPGSRILIRDEQPESYFRELRNHFFGVKILKFFDDPGSGIEKIRIRDGKNSDPG
jgi:hypothetical protein